MLREEELFEHLNFLRFSNKVFYRKSIMKPGFKFCRPSFLLIVSIILLSFMGGEEKKGLHFSYKESGLTERQAAAHLLSRFTYGARQGDVDAVVEAGLEQWFLQQLKAGIEDNSLNTRLETYDAIKLSNTEAVNTYPKAAKVLRMAVQEGAINKDSVNKEDKEAYKNVLASYMEQKGFKPEKELFRQFINQKILRAIYTNNQLQELMTDFWFNHFNVSITKNDCAAFIPAYERDVIRTNALGKFGDLLVATAKSPAMLMYLDNFTSSGVNTSINANNLERRLANGIGATVKDFGGMAAFIKPLRNSKKAGGLNENYAREIMELHTLGVDGGYTQKDVTEAARVLTGWTVYPISDYGPANTLKKVIERIGEDKLQQRGFVREGDFLFAANRHDHGEKTVLGKTFEAGGGYEDGLELLEMLSHHTSTAKFISRKIAVRFVCDNPPATLVNKMAKTFAEKDGDIKQVLITMVSSPEFWRKTIFREKTKSPFELAISAVRSLNADVRAPYQLFTWIDKMGQKMYYYQAPTGFPDKGQYWINTGALLNRMNFGLALVSQRIPGVKVELLALNKGHEPESAEAALITYGKMILPERDIKKTVGRLTRLLNDPELEKKVDQAAGKATAKSQARTIGYTVEKDMTENKTDHKRDFATMGKPPYNNSMLSQVVVIIIGSPEFQRK